MSILLHYSNSNCLTKFIAWLRRFACDSDQLTRQMLQCVSVRFNGTVNGLICTSSFVSEAIHCHLAQSGVLLVRALCDIAGIHSGVVQSVKESIGSTRGKTIHNAWIVIVKKSNGQFRILRVFWRT